MVGYVTMGTSDLDRSIRFFDELFAEFGGKQLMNTGRLVMYGKEMGNGMFAICTPFDEQPANSGNGPMVALNMESPEQVAKLHAKALELGATSDGEPGERMKGFYGAYFRDFNGNKFCGFCLGA